jgi:Fe-S-cluster containining protein
MSQPDEQKWYAEGLKFECQRCGACCSGEPGYVWVTPREAARIAKFLGLSPEEFASQYLRKAGSYESLAEMPDGRCIFYAEKTCAIYAVRPVQCRTFPFWRSVVASPEAWIRCREECPGIGKGRLFSAEEIEEILRMSDADGNIPKLYFP